jgi:hypothetical protein
MAVDVPGKTFGFGIAAADMSGAGFQYRAVTVTTAPVGSLKQPTVALATTAGGRIAGVLYNKPRLGMACTVIEDGIVKWEAGAAIATPGIPVTTDTTGRAIGAATGNIIHGTALQSAGAAGEIITVQLEGKSTA